MESRKKIVNLAFYKFVEIDSPEEWRVRLLEVCRERGLKGTILLASEGINGMLAGDIASVEAFENFLTRFEPFRDLTFQLSFSDSVPFRRLLVKVKKEILTSRNTTANPLASRASYISPEDLANELQTRADTVLVDVRNGFEVEAGTFEGALNPNMKSFTEFERFAKSLGVDKNKKIVTFCTGGIRCEKGALLLREAGFKNVFQLRGGILAYLAKTSGTAFRGRCFVFDERESLNHRLEPLKC